jgi:serine/threonine protein kinase/Tol biopolymer transport system component
MAMTVSPGTRLGLYEILGLVGTGGMGEVYRARDLKLGRDVALKALPDAVAARPERRARFEREARLLASLNHPHVAAIYELLETDDGVPVLVLELVEGETLDACIARGPLPVREALRLADQIAEALEAAHERRIIHRDLKPSNVKITRDGRAKLLDFGLAKALEEAEGGTGSGAAPSSVETLTSPADETTAGAVLGTAPYMSPEQARGEAIDKRTDVWAFGCVLFEMLSGRRAFGGATHTEAIAAVAEREPHWEALPEGTPDEVRALLRRCLRKDKGERLHDIGDARIELKEAVGELPSVVSLPARRRGRGAAWFLGICVASVAAASAVWFAQRHALEAPPSRLTFAPPPGAALLTSDSSYQHLALSPRGERVAFLAYGGPSMSDRAVYVHEIGQIEARRIPGTDGARSPFFSPDGRWLGFSQAQRGPGSGRLKKVSLDGGEPVTICDHPAGAPGTGGADWGPDGTIVFVPRAALGLWLVSSDGGTPRQLTKPDPAKGDPGHAWPQILPGGRAALFSSGSPSSYAAHARIEVVDLETGHRHVVLEGTGFARYSPTGHLLYAQLGKVFAVRFATNRLSVSGPAVPVLDDVQMNLAGHSYADFDTSASKALVYVPGFPRAIDRSLLRAGQDGRVQALDPSRRPYSRFFGPRLSPDGRRLLVTVEKDDAMGEIWSLDLERGTWGRVTPGLDAWSGQWAPDGRSIAFVSSTASGDQIMTVPADAGRPPTPVGPTLQNITLGAWSPDGKYVLFQQALGPQWDLGVLPLTDPAEPRLLLAEPFTECCAALSPDGGWMAYVSNETGQYEVYLRRFPGPGDKLRVSADGGVQPRWSRDGREVFYRWRGARPKVMAVPVATRGRLSVGRPRPLFDDTFSGATNYVPALYDVGPDGSFVFVEDPAESPAPRQLVLIPDFARELKEKLRAAGR